MIYKFNPINMLYHYLIKKKPYPPNYDPKYAGDHYTFLNYDELTEYFATDAEIITVFESYIHEIPNVPIHFP